MGLAATPTKQCMHFAPGSCDPSLVTLRKAGLARLLTTAVHFSSAFHTVICIEHSAGQP